MHQSCEWSETENHLPASSYIFISGPYEELQESMDLNLHVISSDYVVILKFINK